MHSQFKNKEVSGRYLPPLLLESTWLNHPFIEIGLSEQNRPIRMIRKGNGPIRVMMWSQMHGNETTTTKALLDFLNFLDFKETKNLLASFSLCIIPMLNPDGALAYTRSNADQMDLNRDAQDLSQKESVVLRSVFDGFSPHYCFNLHDQRTIFGAGHSGKPARVSFLSPSADAAKQITPSRLVAMQIIAGIKAKLEPLIPGQIGRYDDAFNLNCVGDTFQSLGVPTILFEAGHNGLDYSREETRQYIFTALVTALQLLHEEKFQQFSFSQYDAIPQNLQNFADLKLINSKDHSDAFFVQYLEVLQNNRLFFKAEPMTICDPKFAHRDLIVEGHFDEIRSCYRLNNSNEDPLKLSFFV